MDHVRHPYLFAKFQRRPTKLRKPLGIVRIILAGHAVELVAVEVFEVVHEVVKNAVERAALENRRKTQLAARRNRQAGYPCPNALRISVARKQDGDLMTQRHERLGQRFDYIGQTAGFGKGESFRGDEKYFHIRLNASNVLNPLPTVKDA